jgi:hypothetical protein
MYVDEDWVKLEELGADNGLCNSFRKIAHPAIEALFTIDEETE